MERYLDLMSEIIADGDRMENRTGVDTLSLFGRQIRFDLRDGFPVVTTKKVHFKSVVHELLWMLSGSTKVAYLQENGVRIWNEWASAGYRPELGYEEGELGPVYGAQWRDWGARHNRNCDGHPCECGGYGVDQIDEIVDKLRNKPQDRRILLSAWNVTDVPRMKLPPCHLLAQFSVRPQGLACHMYIRSWDFFLGGPFNIAQYALLTHMLGHVTGHAPYELIISAGDIHLYVNHLEQAEEQLARDPKPLPRLLLHPGVKEIDDFRYDHVALKAYEHHPPIQAEVAV